MSEPARVYLDVDALDGMTDDELQQLLDETVNDGTQSKPVTSPVG